MDNAIEAIKTVVCDDYNITLGEIDSECRVSRLARPRQVAMYLSRTLTSTSFPDIGREFKKDHTTIIHGVRNIQRHMDNDPILRGRTARLVSKLSGPLERIKNGATRERKAKQLDAEMGAIGLAGGVCAAVEAALLKSAEANPKEFTDAVNKLLRTLGE